MINKISKLNILKGVPLYKGSNMTFTFSDYGTQKQYYENYIIDSFDDLSFIKGFYFKKVRVDVPIDDLYYCNYLMFQNSKYGSKWFYAFIENFEYISDNCTEITFEIDYWQTYLFDFVLPAQHIVRQMTSDDNFNNYYNWYEEPEIGVNNYVINKVDDYIIDKWKVAILYKPNTVLDSIVATPTYNADKFKQISDSYKYKKPIVDDKDTLGGQPLSISNTLYNGTNVLIKKIESEQDVKDLQNTIFNAELLGFKIIKIIMIPYNADYNYTEYRIEKEIAHNPYYTTKKFYDTKNNPYQPICNKLFLSPFTKLRVSNISGDVKDYSYERFFVKPQGQQYTGKPLFNIVASIYNSFEMVCYPLGYNLEYTPTLPIPSTDKSTYEYGISLKGVECSWSEGGGTNTLKNLIGTIIAGIGAIASSGSSVAMGALGTSAMKTGASIFNGSDISGNGASSFLNILGHLIGFRFYQLVPSIEDAESIDFYLYKFGYYQNNNILEPNIYGNKRFNYVKTLQAMILGNIPVNALEQMRKDLNNGMTFWHDIERPYYGSGRGEAENYIVGDNNE